MSETLQLSDFDPASREEWQARVLASLKGRHLEALKSSTEDGIEIEPLYGPVSSEGLQTRAGGKPWTVIQRMDHPEPLAAHELAREDIDNGASGLAVVFTGAPSARGFGLKPADARSLGLALKDLPLHRLDLRLEAGQRGPEAAEALAQVIHGRSLNPERMSVSFGMDPMGTLAARGELERSWDLESQRVGELAARLSQDFTGPFVEADGRVYHDGGASEAQELGCVTATAVAYLRLLESRLEDGRAARAIGIALCADADMFLGVAKFRAARAIWRQIATACGLPEAALKLHGETSFRMMSRQDPHGNLLRNVAAVFAAGLGGADSVSALPYSLPLGLPDPFARRMARNGQSILIHEANLHRVEEAAAGSGYVDHLTRSLAEKAWVFFQEIEARGGMRAALESGFVQERVHSARERRQADIGAGKRTIIGVTAFALKGASQPSILPVEPERFEPMAASQAIKAQRDCETFEADRAT